MKIIRYYLTANYKSHLFFLLIVTGFMNITGCNKNFRYRKYHIVQKKETLYSISKKYNVKLENVTARNRIKSTHILKVGQKLIIPEVNSHTNHQYIIKQTNYNSKGISYNNKNANKINSKANVNRIIINKQPNNFGKNNNVEQNAVKNNNIESNNVKQNIINKISWGWPANGKIIKSFIISGPNKNNGIGIAGNKGDSVLSAANGRVVYCGNNLRGYGNLVIIKHNEDFLSAYAHNEKILVKEQQIVLKGQKIALMGDTDASKILLHFEIRYKGKPLDPLKFLKAN